MAGISAFAIVKRPASKAGFGSLFLRHLQRHPAVSRCFRLLFLAVIFFDRFPKK
jgi:hypothetical protein